MKLKAAVLSRIAILAALVLTGCFSQSKSAASAVSRSDGAAPASGADSTDWSHTAARPVTDPALNMTAFTVQIPAGWKFTGMLERIGGCHGTAVPADGLAFTTLAPDGVTAIEKLAGTSWSWSSDGTSGMGNKCAPVTISTAAQFLLNIAVPNLRPDAKNIAVVPFTPEMKQQLDDAQQKIQSQNSQTMKRMIDSARVRLQYTLKGRPVEEILSPLFRVRRTTCQLMRCFIGPRSSVTLAVQMAWRFGARRKENWTR